MTAWLLLVVWVWPLLLVWPAAGLRLRGARADGHGAPPSPADRTPLGASLLPALGALPALVAALTLPVGSTLELPWLFLGTTLALDAIARVYLLFTSILWIAAGIYAGLAFRDDEHGRRFAALFLLAMAGNLWLIVAGDLIGFYVGFAMMGLASYGLVIHDGTAAALRAGKVYLVMALLGEVCLFAAMVMIVQQTGSTSPSPEALSGIDGLGIGLALLGLGVKAGMVPLHLWLPLAHPAAPIPASAVLSGTMIKVALLGWLRFLPVGAVALPEWGGVLAAAGLLTLFFALPIGLVQRDPKVVLAYSSISKMGLLMLILGLVLMEPALAPVGVAAIALYAAHHALVKGGLFLGVGLRKHAALQPLVLGAMVFLALALAGAPFTSGAVAKYAIKPVLEGADWTWIGAAVALATVGTTLLMARFLRVVANTEPHPEPGWFWPAAAWGVLIGLVLLFPFVLGQLGSWLTNAVMVPIGIVLALIVAAIAHLRPTLPTALVGSIPPGDVLALLQPVGTAGGRIARRTAERWHAAAAPAARRLVDTFEQIFDRPPGDTERGLREWPVAGGLWIGITAVLLLFLLGGRPLQQTTAAPPLETAQAIPPASFEQPVGPAPEREQQQADELAMSQPPFPVPDASDTTPALAEVDNSAGGPEPPPSATPDTDEAPGAATAAPEPPVPEPAEAVAPAERPGTRDTAAAPAAETPPPAETDRERASAAMPVASGSTEAGIGIATPAPDPPLDESTGALCDPPTPYVFRPPYSNEEPLSLQRCDPQAASTGEPLRAPALTNRLVAAVQQTLNARGYDAGPVDGIIGPRTRAAIRDLQRHLGLPVDGILTFRVLDHLQARR